MTSNKSSKHTYSLMVKFAIMFMVFTTVTLIINAQLTFINQRYSYQEQCKSDLRHATSYINRLMLTDGDEFIKLKAYFEQHRDDINIAYDFDGNCVPERAEFDRLLDEYHPGKVYGTDISFDELSDECKMAYAVYRYEYWLYRFEQTTDSFDIQYAYFVYPTEGDNMRYMIDGIREKKQLSGADYISLGIEVEEPRADHINMWKTWDTGMTVDDFDMMDNEYGKTYSYFYPLIINGEKVGLICADINVDKVNAAIRNAVLTHLLITVLVLSVCTVITLIIIRNTVLRRISTLEGHVKKYSEKKDPAIAEDILKGSVSGDEIGSLSGEFANMITELEDHMKNLQAVTAEKERIGAELNVATNIQSSMLPSIFPALPEREEFDIYASMTPAKEVGGDFYDFFMADDDHLAIVIADVSGKGVPAALFMVIAKTLIKNHAQLGESVDEILTNANDQLDEGNGENMFVTVWLGLYNIRTGELAFSEAGHESPLLLHADGNVELIKPQKKRIPLASMGGIRYLPNKIQLKEGDCLFLYTDGVPEATDINEKMYGMERLEEFMKKSSRLDPESLLKGVRADVDSFVGSAPQFDDLTMLALKIVSIDGNDK